MYTCPKCGQSVPKWFPLDDAYLTAVHTQLLGMNYPCTNYYCIKCINEAVGISQSDLLNEELSKANTSFNVNLFKGNLAQAIMSLVFRDCGYEVYPYGYENHLFDVIRSVRKGRTNNSLRLMRSSPDLFVYDRAANEGWFLEIKYTNVPDESNFEMNTYEIDRYKNYWDDAFLIVLCARTGNIYCKQFNEIEVRQLSRSVFAKTGSESYVLDLRNTFSTLYERFRLVGSDHYSELLTQINTIVKQMYIN